MYHLDGNYNLVSAVLNDPSPPQHQTAQQQPQVASASQHQPVDVCCPAMQDRDITKLWSEVSRVRRNEPLFTNWNCDLPQFYEPNLFRFWCQALQHSKFVETLALSSVYVLLEDVARATANGIHQTTAKTLTLRSAFPEDLRLNNWPIVYKSLRKSKSIKKLTLARVPIHIEKCRETLFLPESLQELELDHVNFTPRGAAALSKGICRSKLESMTVLLDHGTDEFVGEIFVASVVKNGRTLTKLDIHGGLWVEMKIELACSMKKNTSLKHLSFHRCGLLDIGMRSFFQIGLSNNVTLTHLVFDGCGIGDVRMRLMAENWSSTSALESLTLSNNELGPNGVRFLLDAIRRVPSMRKLILWNNHQIGYEGLRLIGDALSQQLRLTEIDLTNCAQWQEYPDQASSRAQTTACQQASCALSQGAKSNLQIQVLKLGSVQLDPGYRWKEIQFHVGLNACGRHLLSAHHDLPSSAWSHILAKCQRQAYNKADLTYFMLREQPDLIQTPVSFQTPVVSKTACKTIEERPEKRQRRNTGDRCMLSQNAESRAIDYCTDC